MRELLGLMTVSMASATLLSSTVSSAAVPAPVAGASLLPVAAIFLLAIAAVSRRASSIRMRFDTHSDPLTADAIAHKRLAVEVASDVGLGQEVLPASGYESEDGAESGASSSSPGDDELWQSWHHDFAAVESKSHGAGLCSLADSAESDELDDATYAALRLEMEGLRQGGGASGSKVLKTLCERITEKLDDSIQRQSSPRGIGR